MAKVELGEEIKLNIAGAFTTLEEARTLAHEIFTCAIIAIGRDGNTGTPYLRPEVSKDVNIFAYAVVVLQLEDDDFKELNKEE